MAAVRGRRLKALAVALFFGVLAAVAASFGVAQVQDLATSRAIQHGPVVTGTTLGVDSVGNYGGAWLRVEFTTGSGLTVIARLHDGESDGVHQRPRVPVAYEAADPRRAEIAGQPLDTPGQAVIDLVLAAVLAAPTLVFGLAAAGRTPFAGRSVRRRGAAVSGAAGR